jgi:hypothetical protein
MKIKSGIFLLSVGLCITVGNMAQATDQTAPTREGVASDNVLKFAGNTFAPISVGELDSGRELRSLKVQCPKNGFLVARADALFMFAIPAKLPGVASARFGVTRGDEELDAFFTENPFGEEDNPNTTVPFREILVPFSKGSEESGVGPWQPGSTQRVDGCEKDDEFSYAFNVMAHGTGDGTGDEGGLIVTVIAPILVVEFFEKSIQIEDGQNNNGQNNQ